MIGVFSKWGIRLLNTLGVSKLFILSAISLLGLLSLAGFPGLAVREEYEVPHNFRWDNMWEGSRKDPNSLVTALYNVIWYIHFLSPQPYRLLCIQVVYRILQRELRTLRGP
jgi:hypothetical protein